MSLGRCYVRFGIAFIGMKEDERTNTKLVASSLVECLQGLCQQVLGSIKLYSKGRLPA